MVLPGPERRFRPRGESGATEGSPPESPLVVTGSFFRVQADFGGIEDGNATFSIDAAALLGGGKIRPGTRLCNGIACATLATAPVAWRWLLNRYLRYVSASPDDLRLEAAGAMNRATPWVHLYTTHFKDQLDAEERLRFDTLLHSLGLMALARAEEAVQTAMRKGRVFKPDPEEFPELRSDL